ncbi:MULTISPECIES: restriction endonuclease subunit R [unclassified Coleofasciculus]|uniref:restriction endonuclease subunit R n=1 Tax=unclassified Coleofasciculus TaxID=2692782 RepID=UPI00187F75B3|nr:MULTISPECIES: restriction endonuclease subunit R [unclassified Coleofasciculus]MBE9127690.1 restriction endonuclease subunit R [Coleofasciculus sp. LEGE 07081]MBE9151028.1 restriction endonuclease subunit R [Coleofasciculus sp. LEGE 07092]
MAQLIQASELTLSQVEDQFNLRQVLDEPTFFRECQNDLPELSESEIQTLDRVKTEFIYLNKYPMLEDLVKMVILSPLLSLAGFYRPPLRPVLEKRVDVQVEDRERTVWGQIDILLLQKLVWVAVIESKQAGFSLKDATAKTLFYMMANPEAEQATFGLVTNGSHFIFIKLLRSELPQYAFSTEFSLYRTENELYPVFRILKGFAELATR